MTEYEKRLVRIEVLNELINWSGEAMDRKWNLWNFRRFLETYKVDQAKLLLTEGRSGDPCLPPKDAVMEALCKRAAAEIAKTIAVAPDDDRDEYARHLAAEAGRAYVAGMLYMLPSKYDDGKRAH